jgi:phosphoglycolate phosphatase-like HAD superfamily hydrolase
MNTFQLMRGWFLLQIQIPQAMAIKSASQSRIKQIRAILLDLHHTITKTRTDILTMTRKSSMKAGVDLSQFSDDEVKAAFNSSNNHIKQHVSENDVDIHWGNDPSDWFEINKEFFRHLGFNDVSDEQIMQFEMAWRETGEDSFELLHKGAKEPLEELHARGYILGICTRRQTDPVPLLKDWKIDHLLSSVQYSGTPGYAKPSPFTLLKAAEEIGINPRLCAYVGNLVDADVEAALRAEMLPVLTVWADGKEKEKATEDTIIINEIHELLDIFKEPPS